MLRDFPEKEANFRPLWTQIAPDSSLQVRVGFPYAVGQRRVCPDVEARFAQGQRPAAADETVGFVECEGRPGETMPDNQLRAAFGFARREHGSIEEYIAAPRSTAPAASALAMASCSAWCVAEVSCV